MQKVIAHLCRAHLLLDRLLIADKGVIAELHTLVLPTTVVMEYSAGYEALNEILGNWLRIPTSTEYN